MSVEADWQRIESWFSENAPEALEALALGATDEQIAEAEAKLGIVFPDDFRTSLQIHNGEVESVGAWGGEELLSLERILDEWDVWNKLLDAGTFDQSHAYVVPRGPVKQRWWHQLWVPITVDGTGNCACLDFDPAKGGRIGQVIDMDHAAADRCVLAASFAEFLSDYADRLEAGEFRVVEGYLGYDED